MTTSEFETGCSIPFPNPAKKRNVRTLQLSEHFFNFRARKTHRRISYPRKKRFLNGSCHIRTARCVHIYSIFTGGYLKNPMKISSPLRLFPQILFETSTLRTMLVPKKPLCLVFPVVSTDAKIVLLFRANARHFHYITCVPACQYLFSFFVD